MQLAVPNRRLCSSVKTAVLLLAPAVALEQGKSFAEAHILLAVLRTVVAHMLAEQLEFACLDHHIVVAGACRKKAAAFGLAVGPDTHNLQLLLAVSQGIERLQAVGLQEQNLHQLQTRMPVQRSGHASSCLLLLAPEPLVVGLARLLVLLQGPADRLHTTAVDLPYCVQGVQINKITSSLPNFSAADLLRLVAWYVRNVSAGMVTLDG